MYLTKPWWISLHGVSTFQENYILFNTHASHVSRQTPNFLFTNVFFSLSFSFNKCSSQSPINLLAILYSCLLLFWALNLFLQFTELLPMTLSLKQILLLFLCLHSGPKIINVKHLLHSDSYLWQVFIACSFSIVWLFCQKDIFQGKNW